MRLQLWTPGDGTLTLPALVQDVTLVLDIVAEFAEPQTAAILAGIRSALAAIVALTEQMEHGL